MVTPLNPREKVHTPAPSGQSNWLEEQDNKAQKFKRADDWDDYSAFIFARHPRLKPQRVPATEHKEFSQLLSQWQRRIASHQEATHCLDDLTRKQQLQLAALVLGSVMAIKKYLGLKAEGEAITKLKAEAPRRQRMLIRKYILAIQALRAVREYAATAVDPAFGDQVCRVVDDCLNRLNRWAPFPIDSYEVPGCAVVSPITFEMVKLYWFFRHGCNLSGDESEVRVAFIRNAFWTEQGVRKVGFLSKYKVGESKGCPAVHQALRRFNQDQETRH